MQFVVIVLLALLAGLSPAEQPSNDRTSPKTEVSNELHSSFPYISDSQLDQWLKTWQQRLRLEDWNVNVLMVRASQLKPNTIGNCQWDTRTRKATIHVMDPRDYDLPPSRVTDDVELTIVHELVHIHLAVLPRDPKKANVEESVVTRISEALFNLDRGTHLQ